MSSIIAVIILLLASCSKTTSQSILWPFDFLVTVLLASE